MLIWLGVVGTALCLVVVGVLAALVYVGRQVEDSRRSFSFNVSGLETLFTDLKKNLSEEREKLTGELLKINSVHMADLKETDAKLMQAMSHVFENLAADFRKQAESAITDWKQAAVIFTKSEQELADNLAALLREIKVSKALAQGALATVEQNVLAVDKLWQMVEMIRTGPRSATRIAPTDADAAAAERGENDEQAAAIEAMLAGARERIHENSDGIR